MTMIICDTFKLRFQLNILQVVFWPKFIFYFKYKDLLRYIICHSDVSDNIKNIGR